MQAQAALLTGSVSVANSFEGIKQGYLSPSKISLFALVGVLPGTAGNLPSRLYSLLS